MIKKVCDQAVFMKNKVYCDHGITPQWLKDLENDGYVILFYFPYEISNRKIKNKAIPSAVDYDEPNLSYNEPSLSYNNAGSKEFDKIVRILGRDRDKDIKHLDSAYKTRCHYFVTTEKNFVKNKNDKEKLECLLNLKIYYQDEAKEVLNKFRETFLNG